MSHFGYIGFKWDELASTPALREIFMSYYNAMKEAEGLDNPSLHLTPKLVSVKMNPNNRDVYLEVDRAEQTLDRFLDTGSHISFAQAIWSAMHTFRAIKDYYDATGRVPTDIDW